VLAYTGGAFALEAPVCVWVCVVCVVRVCALEGVGSVRVVCVCVVCVVCVCVVCVCGSVVLLDPLRLDRNLLQRVAQLHDVIEVIGL
jgi:hypothetical protein